MYLGIAVKIYQEKTAQQRQTATKERAEYPLLTELSLVRARQGEPNEGYAFAYPFYLAPFFGFNYDEVVADFAQIIQ